MAARIFWIFFEVEKKIQEYESDKPWDERLEKNKIVVRNVLKEIWLKPITEDEVSDEKMLIMDPDLVEKERLEKEVYEKAEKLRDIKFIYENNLIDWIEINKDLIKEDISLFRANLTFSWIYFKSVALDPESILYCSHLKTVYTSFQEEREKTKNNPIFIKEEVKAKPNKKTISEKLIWLFQKKKIVEEPEEKTDLEKKLNNYCDKIESEIKETPKKDEEKAIELATKYILKFYDLTPFPQDNWRMARYLWNLVMIRLWHRYINFLSSEKDKFFEYLEEYRNTGDQNKMQELLSGQFEKTIMEMKSV